MKSLVSYLRGFFPTTPEPPSVAIDPLIEKLAEESLALLEPAFLSSLFPSRNERFVIALVVTKFLSISMDLPVPPSPAADSTEEPPASRAPKKAQPAHINHVFGPRCEEAARHLLRGAPPPARFCYVINGEHHHVCGYHQYDDVDFVPGIHAIRNCPVANPPAEAQA